MIANSPSGTDSSRSSSQRLASGKRRTSRSPSSKRTSSKSVAIPLSLLKLLKQVKLELVLARSKHTQRRFQVRDCGAIDSEGVYLRAAFDVALDELKERQHTRLKCAE